MEVEEVAKYELVKRALIADIADRRLEPGHVVPSETELRARFKVSRPTLVRSLQDLVREGYVYRQQGKGTFVAPRDQHGRKSSPDVKALNALPVFVSSYTAHLSGDTHEVLLQLLRGIEKALQKQGKQYVLRSVSPTEIDADTLAFLNQRSPGTALVIEPSFNRGFWDELLRRGWRVAAVNEPIDNADCIMIDQEHAGYAAAKYLIEQGRKRIVLLNGPIDSYWGFEARFRGYRRALNEAGIKYDAALVRQGAHVIDSESGRQMMQGVLADGVEVDAVIGASDAKAIGAMATAFEAGIRIPEQISFVSIDNLLASRAPLPLPAVTMPFEALGASAAAFALNPPANDAPYHTQINLKPIVPAAPTLSKPPSPLPGL